MVRVTPWALVAGVSLGVGLWMLVSLLPRLNRPRLARRVALYVQDVSAGARDFLAPPPSGPIPVLALLLRPAVEPASRMLGPLLGGQDQVARRLRQSGSRLTVEAYRGQQVLAGVLGALVGTAVAVVVARVGPAVQVVVVAGAGVGGILLRDALLHRAAKARLARLTSELPAVLEFLTLSLSAGEGILDAVRRVARTGSGDLAGEFSGVVAAVGTGLPLADTLASVARELELPPLTRCIEQITGALERGSPLAEVLRAQAQDARDDAKRDLLEVAGRKEVAMMFPVKNYLRVFASIDHELRHCHGRRVAVIIKCPECGNQVSVVKDGFVKMHFDRDGDLCPFTRTAHSRGGESLKGKIIEPVKKRKLEPERVAVTTASVPLEDPGLRRVCDRCGLIKFLRPDAPFPAHRHAKTNRWCSGGKRPTAEQRAEKVKAKRSVWTVSGGLPGLGGR